MGWACRVHDYRGAVPLTEPAHPAGRGAHISQGYGQWPMHAELCRGRHAEAPLLAGWLRLPGPG